MTEAVAEDEDASAEEHGLDLLDVLEAMGTHFHEHHSEIIAWPWKLFCQKWCRLIIAAEREQKRRRRDREKRQEEAAKRDLMAAHHARVGALDQ